MRYRTPSRPHTSTPAQPDRRSAPAARTASWALRPQLLSDAVVAGYIHHISSRHGSGSAFRSVRTARGAGRDR